MNRRNFFRALSAVLSFIGIGATAKSGFTCAGCGSIKTSSVGGGFTRTLEGGRPFWCPDCLHPTERNVDMAKLQRQTVEGMRKRISEREEEKSRHRAFSDQQWKKFVAEPERRRYAQECERYYEEFRARGGWEKRKAL